MCFENARISPLLKIFIWASVGGVSLGAFSGAAKAEEKVERTVMRAVMMVVFILGNMVEISMQIITQNRAEKKGIMYVDTTSL